MGGRRKQEGVDRKLRERRAGGCLLNKYEYESNFTTYDSPGFSGLGAFTRKKS